MTERQASPEMHSPTDNQSAPEARPKKKKASWARTILWMVGMMLLVNVVMALIAYVLHKLQII